MSGTHEVILEVLDHNWNRRALSRELRGAEVTEELGFVGEAKAQINKDDPVIYYLPNPDDANPFEGRWRLYEDGDEPENIVFAGVIDSTSYVLDNEGNHTFSGKSRGIELSWENFGRRDITAWPLIEVFPEYLRANIGKAPIASIKEVSSEAERFTAINAITGDPFKNQMWAAFLSGSNYFTIDLGSQKQIDSIRVIPPWWDQRWYKWNVYTSVDNVSFDLKGQKTNTYPTMDRGDLVESGLPTTARFVKVEVPDSTDRIARMASVLVYQNIMEPGPESTFFVPFIENDDSGNIITSGEPNAQQITVNGAFAGDGIIGHSFVTRLVSGSYMIHTFRGISEAVYCTQDDDGAAAANIYIDNVLQGNFVVPNDSYQYKVFEITGLSEGYHHCKVQVTSGSFQVDYFTGQYDSSWRVIREDDPSIGYVGSWTDSEDDLHHNFAAKRSTTAGDRAYYRFYGDRLEAIGTYGPNHTDSAQFYIDGSLEDDVSLTSLGNIYKEPMFVWSGSYGSHEFLMVNSGSLGTNMIMELDRIQGNFSHVIYQRSAYDHNLAMLTRLSEVVNGYLRFNYDGTVDLLGAVGEEVPVVIREGENEGGQVVGANVTNDYKQTYSAALGLVAGPGDAPVKSFVIDREAVKVMGLKIGKFDNSDAVDAFLLTRQAWQWLQDHKEPKAEYDISYDPDSDDGQSFVEVGDSPRFYIPSVRLNGDRLRIGRKVTSWESDRNV